MSWRTPPGTNLAILMVSTSTIDYRKSQGLFWRITPYRYSRYESMILQPDVNAATVLAALTHYAEGRHSYQAVARHLNKLGHRWRNRQEEAMPFNKHAVRSIVSNVLIDAGWVPPGRGKDMQINEDAPTLRELVLITNAVPDQYAVLGDAALVDQVLASRNNRLDLAVRRVGDIYLLTPIGHCAACGQHLRGKLAAGPTPALDTPTTTVAERAGQSAVTTPKFWKWSS